MKGLIPIQNEDNDCFRWYLVIDVNKNPAIITNTDREYAKQLNFKNIKLLFQKKDFVKIEKQNNVSINEVKTPNHIYASKLTNGRNLRYVLINRFMINKIKPHGRKYSLLILLTMIQHLKNIRKTQTNC